jgi:TolB protein
MRRIESTNMGLLLALALALPAVAAAQQLSYPAVYPAARQGGQYMHNYYIPPAPGTTPWWPSWSPDGRFIAFAMQGSIWKVEVATGAATELTYSGKYHSSPDWSPDGRWIVYTADDDARSIQLEILNIETGESHALTGDDQVYLDPAFSPDGQTLAYVSTKPAGYFNIYMRPIRDGRWAGEEVALTRDNRYPRDRLYFGPWDFHTQPAWLPGGRELLFATNRDVALGAGDVWRMPARANGINEGRRIFAEQSLYRTRPHVSTDGRRFIYSSTGGAADQFNHLYVLPVDGGQPYKLTFGGYDNFHPRWSPDGESIAHISNEGGVPWLWLLETYGGGRKRVEFSELRWKRPMGRLRLRVVDGTGQPTAARIHLFTSDGKFYAPGTAYARRGRSGMHSFHTQGEEQFDVPPGQVRVTATKGFEWVPGSGAAQARAGETAGMTIRLASLHGFDKTGWYSGSTHVHMNYGGNLRNTPENLIHMARAEAMDMVMNQVANKDNRILDYQYFVRGGGEHPASLGDPLVKLHIGQEYRPPFYGHVFFLGLRDHLISPYTTGYEGTGIESLYPSNTDMFRRARSQGAVNGYVHAFSGDRDPLEGNLGVAKGFGVDAVLSVFECLEWSGSNRGSLIPLFHAWNNDLRIAPVGGEDSISNLHWTKLVGSVRTYAYTGRNHSVAAWLDALRVGRTFMSTGPLLHLRINGVLPGEEIELAGGGGAVNIEAAAASIAPLSKIAIYRNGQPWKDVPASGLKETVLVNESGWYALYAEGEPYTWLDAEYPQALTNAIRVYVGGGKIRSKESAEYFVRWVDKLRRMAEDWPWWRSDAEKKRVFAQFDEARAKYLELAAEAQARR